MSGAAVFPPDVNSPPKYLPLQPLNKKYNLIDKLGSGSFGTVFLAKRLSDCDSHQSNKYKNTILQKDLSSPLHLHYNKMVKRQGLVAIKTMMTKLPTLNDYNRVREIKFILSLPASDHLVSIHELFIDDLNFQLHIVMECMSQNLYQMMKHRKRRVFSIPSLKSILAQVLAGIKHIHDYDFFHRDLKPENILITPSIHYFDSSYLDEGNYPDNYVVKLADFGLARHIDNPNPYTQYVSTRWYRSPEILLRTGKYSKPIDIWAFGCVAVEVTIFKALFPGSNELDQLWRILEVLGTPYPTEHQNFLQGQHHSCWNIPTPPGGIWKDAEKWAKKLDLDFPYKPGISLDRFISSTQLSDLTDVIRLCLMWNPADRATVDELCSMPFFQDTVVQQKKRPKSTLSMRDKTTEMDNKENAVQYTEYGANHFTNKINFVKKSIGVTKYDSTSTVNQRRIPALLKNKGNAQLESLTVLRGNPHLEGSRHEFAQSMVPDPVEDTDVTISDSDNDKDILDKGANQLKAHDLSNSSDFNIRNEQKPRYGQCSNYKSNSLILGQGESAEFEFESYPRFINHNTENFKEYLAGNNSLDDSENEEGEMLAHAHDNVSLEMKDNRLMDDIDEHIHQLNKARQRGSTHVNQQHHQLDCQIQNYQGQAKRPYHQLSQYELACHQKSFDRSSEDRDPSFHRMIPRTFDLSNTSLTSFSQDEEREENPIDIDASKLHSRIDSKFANDPQDYEEYSFSFTENKGPDFNNVTF